MPERPDVPDEVLHQIEGLAGRLKINSRGELVLVPEGEDADGPNAQSGDDVVIPVVDATFGEMSKNPKFMDAIAHLRYFELAEKLLPEYEPKRDGAKIAAILCQRINLQPSELAKLSVLQRIPFLQRAIAHAKPQKVEIDEVVTSDQVAPPWEKPTAARNKWLYEQCCKLVPYSTIVLKLNKKPNSWGRLGISGIKKAANAYAKRYDKDPIPKRHSGAPRKRSHK